MLLAEDIDREKIMPKKLIYSELPDDYPKELDELFEFYYNESQIILTRYEELNTMETDNSMHEVWDYLYASINQTDEKKLFKFVYLDWLARNTIPLYYAEFEAMNTNLEFINSMDPSVLDDISYMPCEVILLWRDYKKFPWIFNVRGIIWNNLILKYPDQELSFIYWNNRIWAKGIVLESEIFERRTPKKQANNTKNYIKFKILDTIGNKFPQNEIVIQVGSWNTKMQKNELYVIPIICSYYNYDFKDTITFLNKEYSNKVIEYRASIGGSYKIENNELTKKADSSEQPSWGYFPFTQNEDTISYMSFKERLEKIITFIKSNAGLEVKND